MREIVHIQAGQCGNQIGSKVSAILTRYFIYLLMGTHRFQITNQFNNLTQKKADFIFSDLFGFQGPLYSHSQR